MRPDRMLRLLAVLPAGPPAVRLSAGLALALLLGLLLPFAPGPAWAQAQATSAKVLYYGDFSSSKSSAVVLARPGTRFGLEIAPEGGPQNAPVVLEVRLIPPGNSRSVDPVVFLASGRMGQGVQLVYQFAYEWEVLPGTWSMEVLCGETRLTGAVFVVSKAEDAPDTSGRDMALPPMADMPVGAPHNRRPDKPADKSVAKTPDKSTDRQPDKSPDHPAAKPPEPGRDRSPASLSGNAAPPPTRTTPTRRVGGHPERRVYVVMGGAFSQEGRALWMAALLKGQGANPCVRRMESDGRTLWGVVLGWRDSLDQAKRLRDDMTRIAKDLSVVPMSAGDLEAGLVCK